MTNTHERIADLANRYFADSAADKILAEFVVIPRADLPEVVEDRGDLAAGTCSFARFDSVEEAWDSALSAVAVAEHVKAHPPVDEAQVDALADLLTSIGDAPLRTVAYRLAKHGVTVPKAGA